MNDRPLVPDAGHARRRQACSSRAASRSCEAGVPRPPVGLGHERQPDRDLRPGDAASGPTTARRRSARCRCSRGCTCCRTATSTTTPPASRSTRSASPTTRRSGTSPPPTTRRRGAGPTSASRAWTAAALGNLLDLGLRRSRCPTSPKLGIPGGGKSVDDPRLPRLDVLGDAAAGARRARALHEGVVPHRRRRARTRSPSPGSYFATSDSRITTVDTDARRTRSRPSRPATCTGRAGTRPACCCRPAR